MPPKNGGKFQVILTKEYLEEHYVRQQKEVKDIAQELGCSNSVVDKAIRRVGLRLRGKTHEDLTGREFGAWRVIGLAEKRSYKNDKGKVVGYGILWHCECSQCGLKTEVWGQSLRQGESTQCKECAWKQLKQGAGDISGQYWGFLRRGAKKRNLEVSITIEDAWRLFLRQNRKCALTGWQLCFWSQWNNRKEQTASLDRIDSSFGYIPGNVQWVHKDVNQMKWAFDESVFIRLCIAVAKHHANKMRTQASNRNKKMNLCTYNKSYIQEPDCCSDEVHHQLDVLVEDGGSGPYLVISTNRWAFENTEDIMNWANRLCMALRAIEEEETIFTEAKPD